MINSQVVVGIDVGGPAKGFHGVALKERTFLAKFASRSAEEIAAWCVARSARVVAVDAPCAWRSEGATARAAERGLAAIGISSFSTPTKAKATGHPFFTWMLAGSALFEALGPTHPIYHGDETAEPIAVSIETFPQAVACALAGQIVSAKKKNEVRRKLLIDWGLTTGDLSNIDEVDAALCAVAANAFAQNRFQTFGESAGGFIVVPSGEIARTPKVLPQKRPSTALNRIIASLPNLTRTERSELRSRLEEMDRPNSE